MLSETIPGVYRHYKGGTYRLLYIAELCAERPPKRRHLGRGLLSEAREVVADVDLNLVTGGVETCVHTVTRGYDLGSRVVVYVSLQHQSLWIRPLGIWCSPTPDHKQRFSYVGDTCATPTLLNKDYEASFQRLGALLGLKGEFLKGFGYADVVNATERLTRPGDGVDSRFKEIRDEIWSLCGHEPVYTACADAGWMLSGDLGALALIRSSRVRSRVSALLSELDEFFPDGDVPGSQS